MNAHETNLTSVAELQRHVEEKLHERPRLRDKHNRLVSEAHILASLLGKMKVPPDPNVFDARQEVDWLLGAYSDYLTCLFRHLEPVAELIRANAADYGGAKTTDFVYVQAVLTDFLAHLQNAREELREPVEP